MVRRAPVRQRGAPPAVDAARRAAADTRLTLMFAAIRNIRRQHFILFDAADRRVLRQITLTRRREVVVVVFHTPMMPSSRVDAAALCKTR